MPDVIPMQALPINTVTGGSRGPFNIQSYGGYGAGQVLAAQGTPPLSYSPSTPAVKLGVATQSAGSPVQKWTIQPKPGDTTGCLFAIVAPGSSQTLCANISHSDPNPANSLILFPVDTGSQAWMSNEVWYFVSTPDVPNTYVIVSELNANPATGVGIYALTVASDGRVIVASRPSPSSPASNQYWQINPAA